MLRLEHVHHYIPGTDSVPVVYSGSGRLLTDFLPVSVRGRPVCKLQYSPMVHHGNLEAYRRWVCASLVPRYRRTRASGARVRVKPCPTVCEDVEQQCPYLLPDQTV
nr:unnamed protein product [Callosobruchus chinensis]